MSLPRIRVASPGAQSHVGYWRDRRAAACMAAPGLDGAAPFPILVPNLYSHADRIVMSKFCEGETIKLRPAATFKDDYTFKNTKQHFTCWPEFCAIATEVTKES